MIPPTPHNGKLLAIFAKQPIAGTVKTRLAQATSDDWAQRVAQAFLGDSLDRFSRIDASRAIAFAPAGAAENFATLAQGRYDLIPQSAGDLGQRLHTFFVQARQQGYLRIVALGADSPTLPIAHVEQAFQLLDTSDVVIGPALDGGYYLIGCGTRDVNLFTDIPWSTPSVLATTVRRIEKVSARLALLPPWYDVDTADDWAMLRGYVLSMRQAGIDPGVPRVERLICDERQQGDAK